MPILLDSDVAIHLRDGNDAVLDRITKLDQPLAISAITRVELENGVYRDPQQAAVRRPRLDAMLADIAVLEFGDAEAVVYGRIIEAIGYSRAQVNDRMIAAQAIVADATLITMNGNDFRKIPGLALEVWASPG